MGFMFCDLHVSLSGDITLSNLPCLSKPVIYYPDSE